jgi:arylsulfatase A-like enzyme
MDWLPTFGRLAKCKSIDELRLDGKDISSVLLGKDDAEGHDVFHYYHGFNLQAVRSGPWKLHLAQNELYNLDDDLGEANNVAAAHADIVAQLQKHAETMRADLGDKTKDAPGVRELGRVANPQPLIHADGTVREGFNKIAKKL